MALVRLCLSRPKDIISVVLQEVSLVRPELPNPFGCIDVPQGENFLIKLRGNQHLPTVLERHEARIKKFVYMGRQEEPIVSTEALLVG